MFITTDLGTVSKFQYRNFNKMAELQRVSSLAFSDITSVALSTLPTSRQNGYNNSGFNGTTAERKFVLGESAKDISLCKSLDTEAAIVVTDACKSYIQAKKKRPVLQNFCMYVKKGTIYSLLGSSGCGKTTILSCIVSMKRLESGKIEIFGKKPAQSGVPGKQIGFMPQETALYKDFTVKETITYFGSLYGMKKAEIMQRWEIITNLLSLPDDNQRISTLSGGQKRRVSLAVSLIHAPPLLILDEPTVGVDALLRQNIWKHLIELVSNGKTTVIITTHYLDEASRNTDRVGVMRGGRLLAEASPAALFEKFKMQSLEDIVLTLCSDDEQTSLGFGKSRSRSGNIVLVVDPKESNNCAKERSTTKNISPTSYSDDLYQAPSFLEAMTDSAIRIKSLILKNCYVMWRNVFLVLFVILLPACQTLVMGFSMGNDPKPIKVGYVNHEFTGGCNLDLDINTRIPGECDVANLSCLFLQSLPPDIIQLSYYMTEEDARNDIKAGNIRSFMTFLEGYSDAMYARSGTNIGVDNDTLQSSMILIEMDASNAVVTKSLQKVVYETFKTFVQRMLSDCGLNPELGGLPIKFQNPIYGRYDLELREYVAAGVLVGVVLFFPLCSSSITYIWDKKQGTMERARVAGTATWEIMASYFATEGIVLCMQTLLSLLILIFIFKIPIIGSPFLAVLLLILNGLAGISLGLLIASLCSEEISAILLGLAIIFPNFFLAGSIWPIEGMPILLQYVSYFLPGTLANESFRSIVVRGWSFGHPNVYLGFAATCFWLILYFALIIFVHAVKLRKN